MKDMKNVCIYLTKDDNATEPGKGKMFTCQSKRCVMFSGVIMLTLVLSLILSVAELTAGEPKKDGSGVEPVTITEIMKRPHPEQADREVLVKRIVLEPGASAPAHVHPGMITGYVVSGSLEFRLKGESLQFLKEGDTFFEPPGSHHMVARNPDAKVQTVIIAFVVNPKGAPLSTPLPHEGSSH